MRALIDIRFVHFVTTCNANFYRCLVFKYIQFKTQLSLKCFLIAYNGPLNGFYKHPHKKCKFLISYQFVIAQWSAWQLPTWEVLGSNPGKEENLLISDKKRKFN